MVPPGPPEPQVLKWKEKCKVDGEAPKLKRQCKSGRESAKVEGEVQNRVRVKKKEVWGVKH